MPILVNGAGNTQPMPEGPNNKPTENKTGEEKALSIFQGLEAMANTVENLTQEIVKEGVENMARGVTILTPTGAAIKQLFEKMGNDLDLANKLFNTLDEAAKNTINKVKDVAEKAFEDTKQKLKDLGFNQENLKALLESKAEQTE